MRATPISVIIPVRNEGGRVGRTIQSIVSGRSRPFPLEIVVVDDASTDGACAQLEPYAAGPQVSLTVRRLGRWSGIPFARNRGAEVASHPIYFITDGNTRFAPNWDLPIWRHFHRGRMLAATIHDLASPFRGHGCRLMLPAMAVTWLAEPGVFGGYVPVSACTGTVIDRSLFHHLGGYDETLPLYGAAEPEFSVRAWLSGYEIINVPELAIGHRFRPTTEQNQFLCAHGQLLRSNYLRFACCYLPEDLLLRTYDFYAGLAPEEFNACLAQLVAAGVWTQRETLQRKLRRDFRWFATRFAMIDAMTDTMTDAPPARPQ